MTKQLAAFKRFHSLEHAMVLAELLREEGITVEIKDSLPPVDVTFVGGGAPKAFDLLIPEEQHPQAKVLLEKQAEVLIVGAEEDHYLYGFSNEELLEVLREADSWIEYDVALAKKILNDRGVEVKETEVQQMQEQRLAELAQSEDLSTTWIIAGYGLALVGGLLGFICGLLFWTLKKRLPDGSKVYTYSKSGRRHGMIMFFISIVSMVFSFWYSTL